MTRGNRWLLPERDAIAPLIGAAFDKRAYDSLFRLTDAKNDPSVRDRNICSRFSVERIAIEKAIAANRLTTCVQVGAALRAGANCGSRIPKIEEMLRDVHASM